MKLKTTIPFLLILTQTIAQNKTVEKSVWNAQAGWYGLYVNNEFAISDKVALRVEVGLEATSISASPINKSGLLFSPIINVEPRYYYNIEKRADAGKKTAGNSANFLAFRLQYDSDIFQFTTVPGAKRTFNDILIVPKWGVRRVHNKLHFEAGAGAGIVAYVGDAKIARVKSSDIVLDIHLRIGFNF